MNKKHGVFLVCALPFLSGVMLRFLPGEGLRLRLRSLFEPRLGEAALWCVRLGDDERLFFSL